MRNLQPLMTLVFAVWLAGIGAAFAQLPGTAVGHIFDENGEAVPDVTITVTNPERPDYEEVFTSNKSGRYKVFLTNATIPYTVVIAKPGYVTVTLTSVKIPARQETRRDFKISSEAAAMAKRQMQAAELPAETAEDVTKGDAMEVFNKGVTALDAGDTAAAEAAFLAAIERKPDLGQAYAALARVYLEKKDYQNAATSAEKALELETEPSSMHQVLYASYSALGDKKKAESSLAVLKAADPEKASKNMFNEAADLYNAGQVAEAAAAFEQIIATDPNQARAYYMLGLCYVNDGDNAKAKAAFEKFIELAPDDPDAATAKEMIQYLQ